jgi:hypothetical protein
MKVGSVSRLSKFHVLIQSYLGYFETRFLFLYTMI